MNLIGQLLTGVSFPAPQAPESHEELIWFWNFHSDKVKTTQTESPIVVLPAKVLKLEGNS